MNRPQFFFTTPEGFTDVPYVRPTTPGQDVFGVLPAGQYLYDYVVQLDNDADQFFRSLGWQGLQQGQGGVDVQVRLRDALGHYITDGFVPIWNYSWLAGSNPPDGGSGRAKVFEPQLYARPGSTFLIDFFNSGSVDFQYPGYFEYRGVKRYVEVCDVLETCDPVKG